LESIRNSFTPSRALKWVIPNRQAPKADAFCPPERGFSKEFKRRRRGSPTPKKESLELFELEES
jgi:hypothetical protein